MLIYLASVQKNIIPLFHYALKSNGFLMLGSVGDGRVSRPVFAGGSANTAFIPSGKMPHKPHPFRTGAGTPFGGAPAGKAAEPPAEGWDGQDVRQEVDRLLLSRYSPAGVVVDEELEVLEIRGKASRFLSLPSGKVSFNLLKLIPETGLFLEVEKLVHQVQETGDPARQDRVPFDGDGQPGEVNVEVLPLNSRQKNSLLILFETLPARAQGGNARPASPAR